MSLRSWWRELTGVAAAEREAALIQSENERLAECVSVQSMDALAASRARNEAQDKALAWEAEARAQRDNVARLEKLVETVAEQRQEALDAAAEQREVPPPPRLACTCGFTHFTAGGQAVTAHEDGRMRPSGGVLSCLKCGARWALCGNALIEPHPHSMPPVWSAQDIASRVRDTVGDGKQASPEAIRKLQSMARRSATEHLRPRPRS